MASEIDKQSFKCEKCGHTMKGVNFYKYRDGKPVELCKKCLTMHVNIFEPETYLWILEKLDFPYVEQEWVNTRDKAITKSDGKPVQSSVVFGKYLAKMKLKNWQNYRWADTEALNEKLGVTTEVTDEKAEQLEEMRKAYENGEISEAQWKTYQIVNAPEDVPQIQRDVVTGEPMSAQEEVAQQSFSFVDIPQADLEDADIQYLARKWGGYYKANDWIYLEQKYNDFKDSFAINDAAREDTLIQICKVSLKANQALDENDMDTYTKLVRAYDSLIKSGKFSEAQKKEEQVGQFDSIGQLVSFAERMEGRIPRYKTDIDLDKADEAIRIIKNYTKEVVVNDPALSQLFDNFVRKRINAMDKAELQKKDFKLSDEDLRDYHNVLNEEGEEK